MTLDRHSKLGIRFSCMHKSKTRNWQKILILCNLAGRYPSLRPTYSIPTYT